jgi:hypothetical protein
MNTARAFLGTQAEQVTNGGNAQPTMSRVRRRGIALSLRVAVFACFGVVVACSVYDETLLPVGSLTGGGGVAGSSGTGGMLPPGDDATGAGGAGGVGGAIDSSMPVVDSSQGGGVTGSGGSSAVDSSMVTDAVVARDVVDGAVADRSDVSVTPGCPLLIDNMEMGVGQINDGCRNGFWFTFNDGTAGGTITPTAGSMFTPVHLTTPRTPTSMWVAHVNGMGFTSAGMGVNFNAPPSGVRNSYNAGAYVGVTFWALGSGTISFSVPNRDTDPAGGVCADGGRGACFDHFQTPILLNVATWTQYTVLFSSLRQKGFGYAPPGGFDKTAVYGIQWGVTTGGAFDFSIDDVSFIAADGG